MSDYEKMEMAVYALEETKKDLENNEKISEVVSRIEHILNIIKKIKE